ncbi:hypothetical protein B5P44_04445 [Mycobacterium sp. CBMA 213]|nr:hypothetical protein [Mycolicibacterium sp. CBMA 213]
MSKCRGEEASSDLTRYDRQLLQFLVNWAPFGGPTDEETMPEFGMSAIQLRERCRKIVISGLKRYLCADDRVLLLRSAAACTVEPRQTLTDEEVLANWIQRRGTRQWVFVESVDNRGTASA